MKGYYTDYRSIYTLGSGTVVHYCLVDGLPCAVNFSIGKIEANQNDFGQTSDDMHDENDPHVCVHMQFHPELNKEKIKAARKKYNITKSDYLELQVFLGNLLDIGYCNLCD